MLFFVAKYASVLFKSLFASLSLAFFPQIYALFCRFFGATDVYNVCKGEGGGVKDRLNNVKKTALFLSYGFPIAF